MGNDFGGTISFVIIFVIVCFFVFRAITLWYFRINEAVDLLAKIEENTRPSKKENTAEKTENI